MRSLTLIFTLLYFSQLALAQQTIERNGKQVLLFNIDGMQLLGQKDGKVTRASFGKTLGEGEVKVTAYVRDIASVDAIDKTFREERLWVRASLDSRLRKDPVQIPGAIKVLTYSSTAPFEAEVIVIFSKNHRCQLTVTGNNVKKEQLEAIYQALLSSLNCRQAGIISPIRINSEAPTGTKAKEDPAHIQIRGLPQPSNSP